MARNVGREITLAQVCGSALALAVSTAACSLALMLFFADREQPAAIFAAGGLTLTLWAAIRLTDRPRPHT